MICNKLANKSMIKSISTIYAVSIQKKKPSQMMMNTPILFFTYPFAPSKYVLKVILDQVRPHIIVYIPISSFHSIISKKEFSKKKTIIPHKILHLKHFQHNCSLILGSFHIKTHKQVRFTVTILYYL